MILTVSKQSIIFAILHEFIYFSSLVSPVVVATICMQLSGTFYRMLKLRLSKEKGAICKGNVRSKMSFTKNLELCCISDKIFTLFVCSILHTCFSFFYKVSGHEQALWKISYYPVKIVPCMMVHCIPGVIFLSKSLSFTLHTRYNYIDLGRLYWNAKEYKTFPPGHAGQSARTSFIHLFLTLR